jgi:hypothetical protein
MRRMAHLWVGVAITAAAGLPPQPGTGPDQSARDLGERSASTTPASGEAAAQPQRPRPPVRVILPSPYSRPR